MYICNVSDYILTEEAEAPKRLSISASILFSIIVKSMGGNKIKKNSESVSKQSSQLKLELNSSL